jgi:hypothetical protein
VNDVKLRYNIREFPVKSNGDDQQNNRYWVRPLWFLFTVGWTFALSLVIPTLIGFWMDQPGQFNSQPLYTLIGFGVGTVIAFLGLFIMVRRYYLEQKQEEKTSKEQ